jgi:hypothetical protein
MRLHSFTVKHEAVARMVEEHRDLAGPKLFEAIRDTVKLHGYTLGFVVRQVACGCIVVEPIIGFPPARNSLH